MIDRFKAQGEDCMCVVMHWTYSKRGYNLSEYTDPPALPSMHCIEEVLFLMLTYWMRCAACALVNYNTKENSDRCSSIRTAGEFAVHHRESSRHGYLRASYTNTTTHKVSDSIQRLTRF